MLADMSEERGETVWETIAEGNWVFIETPLRFYAGRVVRRSQLTAVLEPAMCVHLITDLGEFVAGKIPAGTEITPLPGAKEVGLAHVVSAEEYPEEYFRRANKRTHAEVGQ